MSSKILWPLRGNKIIVRIIDGGDLTNVAG
jgi:hypothetical protein